MSLWQKLCKQCIFYVWPITDSSTCREFEAYIFEVKKLPGLFGQGKAEVAEYFRSYVEDYNTGE